MNKLIARLKKLLWREDGPTMIEYAFMLALIAVLVAGSAKFLGKKVGNTFKDTRDLIKTVLED